MSFVPLSLTLKTSVPVWVDQWPMTLEKRKALCDLVNEQLAAGHIEPTTSPYNSPVFVIKKKSGKYRLLQDLRAVNNVIVPMGALQCGLPNPNLIPCNYSLMVIDLKDCFFCIPLAASDKCLFAFTVPEFNNSRPTARYQWKVLPQGMLNSPTMCQYFVDKALQPYRIKYPTYLVYHYMDDILVASADSQEQLKQSFQFLQHCLLQAGLHIAPDKVQMQYPFNYLGHKVLRAAASPVLPRLSIPNPTTLVQLQQILGTINWARPYLGLPTSVLSPLFQALVGHKHPADVINLTEEQLLALEKVNMFSQKKWVNRASFNQPLHLALFYTPLLMTAALIQVLPTKTILFLEWLHLQNSPRSVVFTRVSQMAHLINKGRTRARHLMGIDIFILYVPCRSQQWELLFQTSEALQEALELWNGTVSCHLPPDTRIQLLKTVPMLLCSPLVSQPIPDALTIFTDGSKTQGACTWKEGTSWNKMLTAQVATAQQAELAAFLLALTTFSKTPINIIVDSQYVSFVAMNAYDAYFSPNISPPLLTFFLQLQQLLQQRTHSLFVAHIRSHQHLPGFLSEGNHMADEACKMLPIVVKSPIPPVLTAGESHDYFHQNAKSLVKQFGISKAEAQAILQQCPSCSQQAKGMPEGVNPRGLSACETWQMDVTQYLPFSPWKYLHVSVDTYSGFIMATAQRGETAGHVKNHCIRSFLTLGCPKVLKTDNGPAYVSSQFAEFCRHWSIIHKFGIPYNSQGQAIAERANSTLKTALDRYILTKGVKGSNPPSLPVFQNILNTCLYTLNFLNLTRTPSSTAASRHFSKNPLPSSLPLVYYRRLPDPKWKGPASLITWGKGYAAIQLDDKVLWVPARCVRPYHGDSSPFPSTAHVLYTQRIISF